MDFYYYFIVDIGDKKIKQHHRYTAHVHICPSSFHTGSFVILWIFMTMRSL